MIHSGSVRRLVGASVVVLLCAGLLAFHLAGRAGAGATSCQSTRAAATERAQIVTGSGTRTVVIGDSWSVGLGLEDPADSWPRRLGGEVHVAGFSGSGFSATAVRCGDASFAARAAGAVRAGAGLVVVEGGLNDHDQSPTATTRGFERLMVALASRRVVVVGPAAAPLRGVQAQRVDTLLRGLAKEHEVPYISTLDLSLDYLEDGLHLTETGHREFGEAVAARLAVLVGPMTE